MTDPIIAAAQALAGQLEYARHQPWVDEFLADIAQCARVIRGIARGSGEQKYLGPCGAPVMAGDPEAGCPVNCACHNGPHYACDEPGGCGSAGCGRTRATGETCEGDVYGYRGAARGTCRTCGAEVATAEREAWLDGLVRDHAFTDVDIADALRIPVKTIRSWATDRPESRNHHGKLIRSASPAKLLAHAHDRDGRPLYLLGHVADLAAADAARRETNRTRRTRRTETAA